MSKKSAPTDSIEDIKQQLHTQRQLLEENNRLLHSLHRGAWISFWFRIFWYAVLLGLPFILYFYVIEPYVTAITNSIDQFGIIQFNPVEWWDALIPKESD